MCRKGVESVAVYEYVYRLILRDADALSVSDKVERFDEHLRVGQSLGYDNGEWVVESIDDRFRPPLVFLARRA